MKRKKKRKERKEKEKYLSLNIFFPKISPPQVNVTLYHYTTKSYTHEEFENILFQAFTPENFGENAL